MDYIPTQSSRFLSCDMQFTWRYHVLVDKTTQPATCRPRTAKRGLQFGGFWRDQRRLHSVVPDPAGESFFLDCLDGPSAWWQVPTGSYPRTGFHVANHNLGPRFANVLDLQERYSWWRCLDVNVEIKLFGTFNTNSCEYHTFILTLETIKIVTCIVMTTWWVSGKNWYQYCTRQTFRWMQAS